MDITVIADVDGFRLLRDAWTQLHAGSAQVSIFNSWEWQYHWWRIYGKDSELRLITVYDHNKLVAILPLHLRLRRVLRVAPVRVMEFVGIGGDTSPDYLGPVMQGGREAELSAVLSGYLAGCQDYDVLRLTDMPVEHDFLAALERKLLDSGRRIYQKTSSRIALVRLSSSWDSFLKDMGGSRRYNVLRPLKKIERDHSVKFYFVKDKDALDRTIDDLVRLHTSRWADRDMEHAFSSPEYIAFHSSVVHACHEHGWVRLYCLEVDGKVIGVRYCYRFRNQIQEFQSGFDPEFSDYSPGRVITAYILKSAMEEGDDTYDFLKGEYGHKDAWANDYRETRMMTVYRRTYPALLHRLRFIYMPLVKSVVKRMLGKGAGTN